MITRIVFGAAILLLIGSFPGVSAEQQLSGSEAFRAEKCTGAYVCDEDGSWGIADLCSEQRAAIIAAEERARVTRAATSEPRETGRERHAHRD